MDSHQSASLFAAKSFLKHSLSHSSAPRGPLYHAADAGCSARPLSCPSEARGLGTEITPYWVMLAAWVGLGEARPRRLRAQCQIVSRMDSSWLGELGDWVVLSVRTRQLRRPSRCLASQASSARRAARAARGRRPCSSVGPVAPPRWLPRSAASPGSQQSSHHTSGGGGVTGVNRVYEYVARIRICEPRPAGGGSTCLRKGRGWGLASA